MKTLVLGNSLEVFNGIKEIYNQDKSSEIILFATEGLMPYDRALLPAFIAGLTTEKELFKKAQELLLDYHLELITNEAIARISVKRRYLTTDQKKQISYEKLVLVDTGSLILPGIKGLQKSGVFDAWLLSSMKALRKDINFLDSFMIPVTNIQGLNMAFALCQLQKEVTVLSSTPGLLPDFFDEETGLLLKQILEENKIRVLSESVIEEILGDAQVKAVKLKSGKVLACDSVIIDEARMDLRMLSDPQLEENDKICLEACFKPPVMPFMPETFGLNVMNGFFAGWTKLLEGGREYLKYSGPPNTYKKIFAKDDHLSGLVLFNAPEDNERLLGVLSNQEAITGKEEAIL
ncbi:MAG: FAD-dependent oxidoreductase [Candidatus Omnitrophica bacterium]|nr:FAD-dependent oxidoreductase [Candidatus Omnitrophota bacterium]